MSLFSSLRGLLGRPTGPSHFNRGDTSNDYPALHYQQHRTSSACKPHLLACVILVLAIAFVVILLLFTLTGGQKTAQEPITTTTINVLLRSINASHIRGYSAFYAGAPHMAGSPRDYETAQYTLKQWEAAGISSRIVSYDVLLSFPVRRSVKITSATPPISLSLAEDAVEGDQCTQSKEAVPPFNAYSASGRVTGPAVYVNYGRPEDFRTLKAKNVELSGCIALIRYGKLFRGLKVKVAQDYNISAVLLYSDPADDGFVKGAVYPDGPWRPATSVQRGSALFLSSSPGDPSTPGYPSVAGAPRVPLNQSGLSPSIPVQPISYQDATLILQRMEGHGVPKAWQGGLPFPYHLGGPGPGATMVEVDLLLREELTTVWNVIGVVPGTTEPDRSVIIGNHRDAWVCGAVDPVSGTAAQMELAQAFGSLLKIGWRPRRTLILASWDAEEQSLIGSTEWVEENAANLQSRAVAYINVDEFTGTSFKAGASPSLNSIVMDAAKQVADPGGSPSIWHSMAAALQLKNSTAMPRTSPLGSGSDYTAFFQHLGVSSVNLAMDPLYPVYHSSMDSFEWVTRFGDPTFEYHAAIAKWWGAITLRLLDDPMLPFNASSYGEALSEGVEDLHALLETTEMSSKVDLSKLRATVGQFIDATMHIDRETAAVLRMLQTSEAKSDLPLRSLNDRLMQLDRAFLLDTGLPGRNWFRHVIYAPGLFTGYSATIFPGVKDMLDRNATASQVQEQVNVLVTVIQGAARALSSVGVFTPPESQPH